MKITEITSIIAFILILTISLNAGNNSIVFSGGINHHFTTTVTDRPASRPGFIDAYSVSLQYTRQINEPLGIGFRTMYQDFNASQEEGISDASIPVFVTLNYRLFEIGAGNHIQLATGPVFHLNSGESFESEELKKSFETGYGVGVFSGYSLGIWGKLGGYAEGGLLYEKYKNTSNVTALFNLGFAINY